MGILQGAVQITVTINGSSITIDKENFVNLKIKRYIGDTANSFTLEAFDETAYALEGLLQKKKELAPITVQYAAAKNLNNVTTFSGTCLNYQISFVGKATLISITGVFSGCSDYSAKYWFEKVNIEWVGTERWNPENEQWEVDGKGSTEGLTDELYTDYINNENVCAILQFGDNVPGSDITYTNPTDSTKYSVFSTSTNNTVNSLFSNTTKSGEDMIKSENVESLRSQVTAKCQALGIAAYTPVVMAILRQESGGANPKDLPDMFQCSESLGKKPNSITLEESLKQGPTYFKECLEAANHKVEVALQAYNFGIGFANWASLNHKTGPFQKRWCLDFKLYKRLPASYGDDNYVENVGRFYRAKDMTEISKGIIKNEAYVEPVTNTSILPGGEGEHPRVFYNPARIFKRIMKVYSGETGARPDKQYSEYFKIGEVKDTQWVEGVPRIQTNQTAADYIRELCRYSMTVDTDKRGNSQYGSNYLLQSTGYKYFVDSRGHNFVPIDFSEAAKNAPKLTYGTKDSSIISFSTGNIGAIAMTGSIYDKSTGAILVDEAALDELSADVFTIGGEKVMGADSSEKDKDSSLETKNWWNYQISPNNISSTISKTGFEKKVGDTWSELSKLTTTAEMTVWGEKNNSLTPGGFVDITIVGNGMSHYSSGLYYITSMEDNISMDGYTQTCKLIKNPGNMETKLMSETIDKVILNSKGKLTFFITSKYSNGTSVTTETPATALETQYYFDVRYAEGWQENFPAQQKALDRLKSKEYDAISEAKKKAMGITHSFDGGV